MKRQLGVRHVRQGRHQPHANDSDDAHSGVYLIALRLILALVIKMNDDFCLAAQVADASAAMV